MGQFEGLMGWQVGSPQHFELLHDLKLMDFDVILPTSRPWLWHLDFAMDWWLGRSLDFGCNLAADFAFNPFGRSFCSVNRISCLL